MAVLVQPLRLSLFKTVFSDVPEMTILEIVALYDIIHIQE